MAGMPAGAKNAYFCETCGGYTVTIHADEGVTPMFLTCRASGDVKDCLGRAVSMMYPKEPWPEAVPSEPQFEWYKPSPEQTRKMPAYERMHYQEGGLDLRRIGGGEDEPGEPVAAGPGQWLNRKQRRALARKNRKRGRA